LVIPLDLHGVVPCFPTFKPSQQEFETCDRYELTYESPEYDPSAKTFHDQEAGMMDSWVNLPHQEAPSLFPPTEGGINQTDQYKIQ
jgi:hypothetical protein